MFENALKLGLPLPEVLFSNIVDCGYIWERQLLDVSSEQPGSRFRCPQSKNPNPDDWGRAGIIFSITSPRQRREVLSQQAGLFGPLKRPEGCSRRKW